MRMGHAEVKDHMMLDGLENAYDGKAMGCFAQKTADEHDFSRTQMDDYAVLSLTRAQQAISSGAFVEEITPVTFQTRKGEVTFATDEQPGNAKVDKIPTLKPAFAKDGTITAANSSSISDGAAALSLNALRGCQSTKQNRIGSCSWPCHAFAGTRVIHCSASGRCD